MIADFTKKLKEQLKQELPGKKAHQEAAPYRKVDFSIEDVKKAKKSAVLLLFYQKEEQIHTVLIQRTVYKGKHSGQISFPGGKVEESDTSIFDTALREAEEEIGVIKNKVTIIGQLSDVFIPTSNFHVVPVLAFSHQTPNFILEKREVETIIEIDINRIKSAILTNNNIKINNNTVAKVPAFEFNNKIIWGATALMLNELKHVLNTLKD